ncbi:MAG: polyprenyl synthetase family protein [Myxococcota bacterium]
MRETARVVNEPVARERPEPVLEPLADVADRVGLDPLAARLVEIRRWLAADLSDLEADLGTSGDADGDLAERAARHLLGRPGKRIRPLCVFLSARAGDGGDPDVVRDLAVSCELVHAATLLHDDVIDQGTERRGAPTARMVYGNPASVLGGDHLLIEALRRVRAVGMPDLLVSLLDAIGDMVSAEALQLARRGGFDPDPDVYHRVVRGKTAVLFHWAMVAGATAGGLGEDETRALADAGDALGLAFQLVDDALDVEGDPAVTGKDALLDLREGKLTWPLLVACERDPDVVYTLRAIAAEPERLDEPGAGEALRRRLLDTGCARATRERARSLVTEARESLSALRPGPAREALLAVMQAAVERGV